MKALVFILPLAVLIGAGCAGRKKTAFSPVPGPNPDMPELSQPAPSVPPPPPPPVKEQKKPATKKPDLIVTPENAVTGKVVTYNDAGRFVVLDFPSAKMPAVDQRMFVYRAGLKVGEVKINTWQRGRYVVADLTSGEAQSGDEIRDR